MSVVNREPIYVALFDLLSEALGDTLTTIGRRHIPSPPPEMQPALFICGVRESEDPHPRLAGGKLTLDVIMFLYVWGSGINEVPGQETVLTSTTINQILLAIGTAIGVPVGQSQTLGGLVQHCWIQGNTDIDPGIFGQQAVAVIPVKILVP
jgi:hypothetical protein